MLKTRLTHLFSGQIAKATVRTTGVLVLRLLVQAGTLLIVARMLGAAHFGAFSGIVALAVLLGSLSTLGTHLVLLGEVSKEHLRRHAVLPYALPTTLLASGLLFLIYVPLGSWLLNQTGIGLEIILAIGAAELLLQPLITLASVEHQAHGHIARSQLLMTLPLGLRLLVATSLWATHPQNPLHFFAAGYLLATGLAVFFSVWHLPEPWPKILAWRLPTKDEIKQATSFAVNTLTALGPGEIDKALAVKLMPLNSAGLYSASIRIVSAAVLPIMAMLMTAMPRLFKIAAEENDNKIGLIKKIFNTTFLAGILLSGVAFILAPTIAVFFGKDFSSSSQIIRYATFLIPILALRMAAGTILMTQNKPLSRSGIELLGIITLSALAYILAPKYFITGMIMALLGSETVMAISGWLLVMRNLRQNKKIHKTQPTKQ
ncbi:lipopolysaccharide biosynthesis protein [Halothiobacillus sp. DCM-1]|uniref:lipopolysaccharide biosynthesis protein n=1 Tax=Halothiobacillus sp. DCM-1 TaxID=3112558 RepID=UPI0032465973